MKKRKKLNKNLFIFIFVLTAYLVSLIFFTKSILSLTGIETYIRIFALSCFCLFLAMYFVWGFICVVAKKKKTFTIISIIMLIFVPIFSIGAYYIDKTVNKIEGINKELVTYSTSLVTLENTSIKNNNSTIISMIDDEDDIEGYILAQKLIKENDLENTEITYYDDYIEMLTDLLDGKIDGVLISSNYLIMFESDDTLTSLESDTKIVYTYSEEREKEEVSSSNKTLNEPFTILLIGVDSTSEVLNANQSFNGDTLMVITFNPNTLNATMFSIPRDTYVPIACRNNVKNKINTSAYYGSSCIIDTIENLIDINIDYYVKINFKGVVSLVDALGGIDVDVPYSFCEQDSNRDWGASTIYVEEGIQHLDGEQALALSRNRHCWPSNCASKWNTNCLYRNDFTRGQNQQLVVTGIAKSIKNIDSVNEFYEILDAISQNIDTNMTTNQILSFYEVAKEIVAKSLNDTTDFINIERTYLITKNQYINSSSMELYYPKSLEEIVNLMKYNLELEDPDMVTTFDFSANEIYEKKVVGKTYAGGVTLENTMPKLIGKTKEYVDSWAAQNNITVTYTNIEIGNDLFDETKDDGTVVSQSIKETYLLNNITSVTIGIIKK
ncbi:MAG TPA: LCP family protein [Bacilli bacterium]|nr:LCP family protein [Bacilli bacterium]